MWGRTEYPPMVCPPGQVLDDTMYITGQCLDARLYHGLSYTLAGILALVAGLALFTAAYHASTRPGYSGSDAFKLNLLVVGTAAGFCVTWIVWGGGGHGWVGGFWWFVGGEVALFWMACTAYAYCCIPPPQGQGGINAWEGARHRMKTQLIIARVLSCITQVVLTPIDCYYRIQLNRDVSSITKTLIIASWGSSLGITSWIVWTSSHRLAVCISNLCDEMKAMSKGGPQSRAAIKSSIFELRRTAQKIMWTGRFIGVTCALMAVNNIGVVTWAGITIYLNGPKGMMFFSHLLQVFSVGIATPLFAQVWLTGLRDIVHKHVPFTAPDPDAFMITTVGQSSGLPSSSLPGDSEGSHFTATLPTLKMTSLFEESTA